jgi:acyl-CoA synthetase (AMP-forming)/AMP-acid ligase II/acetyltransferase-like isoleucine patch superfamily enzyme/acyl carrier protein
MGMRDMLNPSKSEPDQLSKARSIYQLLKARAETNPEAMALTAPDRSPLTYGGLLRRVENIVEALRAFGLKPNDRVAVALPNGPEMAVAFVAVAAGATCAPLNPAYRESEFDFYISDLGARALIVWSGSESPARGIAEKHRIPIIELTPTLEAEAGVFTLTGKKLASANHDGFAQPDDTALVLHTSGTTSRPKIVPLTHTNVCSSGHNISTTLELRGNDRCLNVMPLFHIHGLIGAILSSLTAGASVFCTPGFDVEKFFGWIDTFRPSWYTAVPTMHQAVLARASGNREIIARTPMRFIRSSSAALPKQVMAELEDTFKTPVIESYGMTEAAHQMTSNPLPPLPRKAGSVGLAAGPDVAIMDEAGNLLPVGEIGEVVIRGTNVTNGYESNPTANQSAFTNAWFRTGDQGRIDAEGYLFLTSRIKEIINRGGEKVAPKEVDDVLMQHPDIAQAITFAVPHATLGEDVAAAVILKENTSPTENEIRDFASARLADFKVPTQVVIVDEIPKGPTGKLQRIGLADKLALKLQSDFVAPRNSVEKQLTEAWRELLKLTQVGVRDNFFVIGGDSLTASMMILEIEKRFNTAIPIADFLSSPTIETITSLIDKKESSTSPAAVSEQGNGSKPIRDSVLVGLKNRLFQVMALYAPGFKTTRVWLHRMRGVSIGNNVSIGMSALIETAYPRLVFIGNNVTIGMRAIIIGHLRDLTTRSRSSNRHTVRIEDDVYIGPGVIVLPHVTIGRGSVVSAGSVVSRSIPPQTLARGNPAKPIARCGVSLGGGVSYEQFLQHLTPIKELRAEISGTDRETNILSAKAI